jgi:hypothetical protein
MTKNKIAIDTEYSKDRKILSLGIYSDTITDEIYFKNKVDKITFEIHGLPDFFLKENGVLDSEIKKYNSLISDFDFIIGFDISNDLEILNFKKIDSLFMNNKIIDIQKILHSINITGTLSKLVESFNIDCGKNNILHSAFTDSKSTYLLFEKIKMLTGKDDLFFAELTTAIYYSMYFDIDRLSYELNILNNHLSFLNSNSIIKDYLFSDNYAYCFINNKCVYRFPVKYFNYDSKFKKINYDFDIIGIKFNKKYIKEEFLQEI